MSTQIYFILSASVIALVFASILAWRIKKQAVVSKKAGQISQVIREGAMTFLNREYRILFVFVVVITGLLYYFLNPKTAIAFVAGAFLSALAGQIGMRVAVLANIRTAEKLNQDFKSGLNVAFNSGSVMAMSVVGLGLLGVTALYLIFKDPVIIYGFGFGASSVALFARVGGGIYTKAADVGADLVGKVEQGIPEDDPRNPATIADNVGDNVGDVAGMGADLFESYVDSIIAAMVIGSIVAVGERGILLPLVLAGAGILVSLISNLFVKLGSVQSGSGHKALNRGIWAATLLMAVSAFGLIKYLGFGINIFYAFLSGLLAGLIIGLATEYFTSDKYSLTQRVAKAAQTGAGTNIIAGFALGLLSTAIPVLAISAVIFLAYQWSQLFGIAIAAVGMLSTLGMTLAADTFGPVVDNAAGIAEMSEMGENTRKRAEDLDAVGNTTAAIGKGFAIGAAALTALVLMVSYGQAVNLPFIDILNYRVIIGLFLGGLMPFLFSSFALQAVGRAAMSMVKEVRRQFRTIKGIMQGKAEPDYKKCVDISTRAALKEMILPSVLCILAPVLVGFLLGPAALAGLLAGSIVAGFLLAITMSNSGGIWDNAKKYIEAGNLDGKGSETHKAAVVGDTVGDPFKDTAGPSLNILLKLMAIVALIIAPLL
ncbi:MAG: potassium transporter [Firmicutes bacterium ML8_F2]|jgi:K(+)-stimulated pyrophosphate-energized sodium pump|nr:MAG: potassium transporter [Firmicutes bacterium ML8_F2]